MQFLLFLLFLFSSNLLQIVFSSTSTLCVYVIIILAIYLLYAKLEEEHGLARHAMEIYDRATRAVQPEDQYEVLDRTVVMSL